MEQQQQPQVCVLLQSICKQFVTGSTQDPLFNIKRKEGSNVVKMMSEIEQKLSRGSLLMYASTPTLNSAGNSSVDESASSTSSNSDYGDHNDWLFSTGRIYLPNPNRLKSTRRKPMRSNKKIDSQETSTVSSSNQSSEVDVKVTQHVSQL